MKIGELAQRTEVPVSTLRFYERRDLLHENGRSSGGYRLYAEEASKRVLFIRRAQSLGFSIEEIRDLLDVSAHATLTREQLLHYGKSKIADIEEKLAHLQSMHEALSRLMQEGAVDWEAPCPIVASLTSDLQGRLPRHPRRNAVGSQSQRSGG